MKPQHTIAALVLVVALGASQSACLKTRSQIKGSSQGQGESGQNDEGAEATSATAKTYEIEEIKSELTRLSGKVEELDHTQRTQNANEIREYATRIDSRVAELEKNQVLIMTELKELKDKKEAEISAAKEAEQPAADLLRQGKKLMAAKKFEDAAEKFKIILTKNSKGKEAADAHFELGEAEYAQKNYKKAIVQYSKVQEASTKSPKIPMSLYKIALSFGHLNMNKEAQGFFAELAERFPKSAEAKKARSKIKE